MQATVLGGCDRLGHVIAMDLSANLDALFQLPLNEFTALGTRSPPSLQKAGRKEDADRVKRLTKPPVSAWVVNQLFWKERTWFDRLLDVRRPPAAGAGRRTGRQARQPARSPEGAARGAERAVAPGHGVPVARRACAEPGRAAPRDPGPRRRSPRRTLPPTARPPGASPPTWMRPASTRWPHWYRSRSETASRSAAAPARCCRSRPSPSGSGEGLGPFRRGAPRTGTRAGRGGAGAPFRRRNARWPPPGATPPRPKRP